jgi:hypothetical protein
MLFVSNTNIQQQWCDGFFVRLEDLVPEVLPVFIFEPCAHVLMTGDLLEALHKWRWVEVTPGVGDIWP